MQAIYVIRVQLLHVRKTLENAAFEVLPAETGKTGISSGPVGAETQNGARNGTLHNSGERSPELIAGQFDWEFSLQVVLATQRGLILAEAALSVRKQGFAVVRAQLCTCILVVSRLPKGLWASAYGHHLEGFLWLCAGAHSNAGEGRDAGRSPGPQVAPLDEAPGRLTQRGKSCNGYEHSGVREQNPPAPPLSPKSIGQESLIAKVVQ